MNIQETVVEACKRVAVKVSVLMITYNHEKFIGQAVQSVLAQQVNFDYEIVVGEDCSTDRTREILLDLKAQNSEKIRLLLPARNLGMHANFAQTLVACSGEYVALLEGDDYWTAPHKLQKQVGFLDAHPDYSMCFHPVDMLIEDGLGDNAPLSWLRTSEKDSFALEDVLKEDFVPTCSILFRRNAMPFLPPWVYELTAVDWPLLIVVAQCGPIGYLKEKLGTYRLHRGGMTAWRSRDVVGGGENSIKLYNIVARQVSRKYKHLIRRLIAREYVGMAFACEKQGAQRKALMYLIKTTLVSPSEPPIPLSLLARMLARLSFPRVYDRIRSCMRSLCQ